MNAPAANPVPSRVNAFRDRILTLRNNAVRLVTDASFPELQSWRGCLRLGGLWLVLLIGCALAPLYALLRMPFRKGGWRFLIGLVGVLLLAGVAGIVMLLAVGLSGMGAAR